MCIFVNIFRVNHGLDQEKDAESGERDGQRRHEVREVGKGAQQNQRERR